MAPINNIFVAKNGIDDELFKPIKTEKRYDIIYLGRLIETKGVSYLIEALAQLRAYPFKVGIAGKGPELIKLRRLVKDRKLSDRVDFLGHVKDSQLSRFYNSTVMAVFPSYDREGILTTMLEAGACGKPVITTTACSMSEYLKDGLNGLLVKPKDAAALAAVIKKLLGDKFLAERLGRQARREIEKKWSWKKRIKRVEKIYADI